MSSGVALGGDLGQQVVEDEDGPFVGVVVHELERVNVDALDAFEVQSFGLLVAFAARHDINFSNVASVEFPKQGLLAYDLLVSFPVQPVLHELSRQYHSSTLSISHLHSHSIHLVQALIGIGVSPSVSLLSHLECETAHRQHLLALVQHQC